MTQKQRVSRLDGHRSPPEDFSHLPAPLAPARSARQEIVSAHHPPDLLSREGLFARLLAGTLEQLLDAERTIAVEPPPLPEPPPAPRGRQAKTAVSAGDVAHNGVPGEARALTAGELDEKVIALYAKGFSNREIQETLRDGYSIDLSATAIGAITDKVWTQVEAWQSRPLAAVYPIVFLDAIHIKLRRDGKVLNTAVYIVLGVDLEGQRDVLGHWVGDGAESANFWLSVLTDLQARGVQDIFIACVDGLPAFKTAIQTVFPLAHIQRCVVHQVRHSLAYVSPKDRKEVANDMKAIYGAPTREAAEGRLSRLAERWGKTYTIAVRSWENNWIDLATMFDYAPDIRRLIYSTNHVESYNSQLRRLLKTKGALPSAEAVRKLLFLANRTITDRWTKAIANWPAILNQLAIRFDGRVPS